MNEYCRLAYVALFLATIASPAVACTQGESEDKMREAIYAAHDLHARNPAKAGLQDHARLILYGASPRATIGMIEAGRALAYLRGRDYALPADVVDVAADVLRHRIVPSYEALAEGISADDLVRDLMRAVPAPEKVLERHDRAANA